MDAVALAQEFMEACLKGTHKHDDLEEWFYWQGGGYDMSSHERDLVIRSIRIALDSKIIITIK